MSILGLHQKSDCLSKGRNALLGYFDSADGMHAALSMPIPFSNETGRVCGSREVRVVEHDYDTVSRNMNVYVAAI